MMNGSFLGGSKNGDTPMAGWQKKTWKIPIYKWMRTGGTPMTLETSI